MKFRKIMLVDLILLVGTLALIFSAFSINSKNVSFSPIESEAVLHSFEVGEIFISSELDFEEFTEVVIGESFVLTRGTYYFENNGEIVSFDIEVEEINLVVFEENGRLLLATLDETTYNVDQNYFGNYRGSFSLTGGSQ